VNARPGARASGALQIALIEFGAASLPGVITILLRAVT